MKIAMIGLRGIPFSEDGGGVDRHVDELSTRLVKLGHEVMVYVRSRYTPEGVTTYKGVKLISVGSIKTKNLDTISHVFLATLNVLFKKVDIVHYHGVGPSTLSWIVRIFKPKTKVVTTFHSIDRFHKKWGILARLYLTWGEWTACHFPHKTLVVGTVLQKYCLDKYNKETVFIPNGVTIKEINRHDQLKQFDLEKSQYLLTVARLVKHKGIHLLIEAYKKIEIQYGNEKTNWPRGKQIKLVIVGSPSYTEDYFEYLKEIAGESKNIIFTGFQGGDTLDQLFANAYLYVHPSQAEGLSTTILEALSHRMPALISDITENLEVIDHSGFIFKTNDVDDLYEKLIYLLDNPEKIEEKKERALRFIRNNFDWDKNVKRVEKEYEELLK